MPALHFINYFNNLHKIFYLTNNTAADTFIL